MNRCRPLPLLALIVVGTVQIAACGQDEQVARMTAALAAPERSAENKARDEFRKPIETVEFLGIETGDTVIDMIAAGGWFTEVLSAAVGPSGKVYATNPPFLVQADAEKALHDRLGNVEAVHGQLDEVGLAGNADAVVTALNLHDLYNGYMDVPGSEQAAVGFLTAIFAALKPGGVLGVIDHVGIDGQDNKALHRMLPQQARDVLTKAGFIVEAESNMLANPADDHTKIVVDPAIRFKTDQFMIRARRPN